MKASSESGLWATVMRIVSVYYGGVLDSGFGTRDSRCEVEADLA